MHKMNLALNNQQWVLCHKTKQNKTKPNSKQVVMPLKSIGHSAIDLYFVLFLNIVLSA